MTLATQDRTPTPIERAEPNAVAPDPQMSARAGTVAGSATGRFYALTEFVMYVGVLNALILVGTLAGLIVFGWAPALSAAAACSRARLHGDEKRIVRRFFTTWRQEFVRANLLQAPAALAALFFVVDWMLFSGSAWSVAFLVAAGGCVVYLVLVVTMDAHYDLSARDVLLKAGRFMLTTPGAPLLLAATLALTVVLSGLLPGLIPILSFGAAAHLCTALCLSFYAANDRSLA